MTHVHGRRDTNHAETRDAFRRAHWYVLDMADLGGGAPDLLCCSPAGRVVLVEVKSPGGVLTQAEAAFSMEYPGELQTVRCIGDITRIINEEVG